MAFCSNFCTPRAILVLSKSAVKGLRAFTPVKSLPKDLQRYNAFNDVLCFVQYDRAQSNSDERE